MATGTLGTQLRHLNAEYKKKCSVLWHKKCVFLPSLPQGNQIGRLNSDQFTAPSFPPSNFHCQLSKWSVSPSVAKEREALADDGDILCCYPTRIGPSCCPAHKKNKKPKPSVLSGMKNTVYQRKLCSVFFITATLFDNMMRAGYRQFRNWLEEEAFQN